MVLMQLVIAPALCFHIISNGGLAPMFADCTRKISIRPKYAVPQLFLDLWALSEYLTRGQTF
jgi:hypothetical protein